MATPLSSSASLPSIISTDSSMKVTDSSCKCCHDHNDNATLTARIISWLTQGKILMELFAANMNVVKDAENNTNINSCNNKTRSPVTGENIVKNTVIDDVIAGKQIPNVSVVSVNVKDESKTSTSKSVDLQTVDDEKESEDAACYRMGNRAWWGWEAPADKRDATQLFERAASHGHRGALAWCHYIGVGPASTVDRFKAFQLWKQEADGERDGSLSTRGLDSIGVEVDLDPEGFAAMQVGTCYHNGFGVELNEPEAYKYYRKAAKKGNAIALNTLGHRCESHDDLVGAAEYYENASNEGYYIAQCNYGRCLLFGRGVARDSIKAAKYFKSSALAGDAEAAYQLGMLYFNGRGGVHRDVNEAWRWIHMAAEEEHEGAIQFLRGDD